MQKIKPCHLFHITDSKILQSDWPRAFWPKSQELSYGFLLPCHNLQKLMIQLQENVRKEGQTYRRTEVRRNRSYFIGKLQVQKIKEIKLYQENLITIIETSKKNGRTIHSLEFFGADQNCKYRK